MSRLTAGTLFALVVILPGCPDDTTATDASVPVDADADSSAPEVDSGATFAPEPPRIDWLEAGAPDIAAAAPPALTACPTGWREVDFDGVTACDPWPDTGASRCSEYEAHFPGGLGCTPVGTLCTGDDWPPGLPAAGVLYVRSGASGDGSRGAPFGRIAGALTAAAPGTMVAVSVGRYDETLTVPAGVAVRGTCPRSTVLGGPVTLAGDGASLANVTVDGASPGITIRADAAIEGVAVTGARTAGVWVASGALTARGLSIRDTRGGAPGLRVESGARAAVTRASIIDAAGNAAQVAGAGAHLSLEDVALTGAGSYGLSVGAGATVIVNRAAIENNGDTNVVHRGGETSLTDVVLRGRGAVRPGWRGLGVSIVDGSVTLARVLAAENHWAGVRLQGGSLTATDLLVVGTVPSGDDPRSGYGLLAQAGNIALERARFTGNTFCGIALAVDTANLTDVAVTDVRESAPIENRSTFGCGMDILADEATLSRIRIDDVIRYGLRVGGTGSFTLEDAVITDISEEHGTMIGGPGIITSNEVTLTATRVLVERARYAGLEANETSTASFVDFAIRDISAPSVFSTSGYAVRGEASATISVARGLFERASLAAVHVVEESSFAAEDLVIRDMLGDENLGLHGWGVAATAGGRATLTRVRVSRARYVGLLAVGPGSDISGTDVALEDTLEAACADDLCADAPFGIGVGAYSGAAVDLESFVVARSHVIGVQLAGGGLVDLTNGEVSMTPIGVNVQTSDFNIDRLTTEVAYTDNTQNLATEELPVPAVGGI